MAERSKATVCKTVQPLVRIQSGVPYKKVNMLQNLFKKVALVSEISSVSLNERELHKREIIFDSDHPDFNCLINRLKMSAFFARVLENVDNSILIQAADEIERLQLRNDYLNELVNHHSITPGQYCENENVLRKK